jgi:outer membrane lipoprotein-sorting protein
MKKIALLLVVFVFSSVSLPAQIREILKRMDDHRKALKSLQAHVLITKFSAKTGKNETKEGIVKFLPQKTDYLLRIDSTKPAPESFSIIGNQYLLYQSNPSLIFLPELKTAYTGTITDSQKITFMIFSILSNFSKENLKANYPINYTGQEKVNGTTPTFHLEFTSNTTKNYKKIELWVDANGMPLQSKISQTNGDSTSVLLTNMEKNRAMKAADFKIDLPTETKLVKN